MSAAEAQRVAKWPRASVLLLLSARPSWLGGPGAGLGGWRQQETAGSRLQRNDAIRADSTFLPPLVVHVTAAQGANARFLPPRCFSFVTAGLLHKQFRCLHRRLFERNNRAISPVSMQSANALRNTRVVLCEKTPRFSAGHVLYLGLLYTPQRVAGHVTTHLLRELTPSTTYCKPFSLNDMIYWFLFDLKPQRVAYSHTTTSVPVYA